MRDRYLRLPHAQRNLAEIVEGLGGRDRIVITKGGEACAVLIHPDRYAMLEDMLQVIRAVGQGAPLDRAWEQLKTGRSGNPAPRAGETGVTTRIGGDRSRRRSEG
jgi:PHD/YefM family antitoxin component YafN of YafNO toxin-antitoxin module